MKQTFVNFVNEKFVNDEEPRALKNLCKDYSNILENFGLYKTVKSDSIKDLLILHFGNTISFHIRHERTNKSTDKGTNMYNRRTDQTYCKEVANFLEVTDEEILSIACSRLRINIKQDTR